MAFELPNLPYAFDALEPHIAAKTMEIHHDRHHKAYTDNLNKAIEETQWDSASIEENMKEREFILGLDISDADKRKVKVVRMVNDTLKSITIDLTDPKNSEMLKLSVKPGDIVYVPSRRGKVWDKRSGSILTVTGVVTTLAIISQLFK